MIALNLDRRGSGTPVVLVHGIGSRWQVFEPVLDLLAAHHDVIAVDLPGFGRTPADPDVVPSVAGFATRLEQLFAELGIERPHVVGNSMGGGIALELGKRGTASRVTAFSPVGFWRGPGQLWAQSLLTVMRASGAHAGPLVSALVGPAPTRAAVLAPFYGRPSQVTPAVARADTAALVGATSFGGARRAFTGHTFRGPIDVPVTVAWGTRDILLTHRTQSRRAHAELPQARHVDLPGCGHLPFSDDPQLCADVVLAEPGGDSGDGHRTDGR